MGNPPSADSTADTARHMTPEEALWSGVVERAIYDARKSNSPLIAGEAWAFLTDASGNWAISRREVCRSAGLDAAYVREAALRTIEPPSARFERVRDEVIREKRRQSPEPNLT